MTRASLGTKITDEGLKHLKGRDTLIIERTQKGYGGRNAITISGHFATAMWSLRSERVAIRD